MYIYIYIDYDGRQPQLQLSQDFDLQSSNKKSSLNNFKRRAYCYSLFFFCHNLNRQKKGIAKLPQAQLLMATIE